MVNASYAGKKKKFYFTNVIFMLNCSSGGRWIQSRSLIRHNDFLGRVIITNYDQKRADYGERSRLRTTATFTWTFSLGFGRGTVVCKSSYFTGCPTAIVIGEKNALQLMVFKFVLPNCGLTAFFYFWYVLYPTVDTSQ